AAALVEAAVGAVAAVVHRVEHPAVHRLEAVAHIRQRTSDDDAHGVVDVRALHLVLQLDRFGAVALDRGVGHFCVLRSVVRWAGSRCSPFCSTTGGSGGRGQMSRKRTSLAFRWMNERRWSTSSPMRIVKISSATAASASVTWRSRRPSGSMVVSHSSLAFISPRPLYRWTGASFGRR